MASETSYLDRYNKGLQLQGIIGEFAVAYDPDEDDFSSASFTAALAAAETANTDHSAAKQPWEDAVDDRVALVKEIGPLVTHSLSYVLSKPEWKSRWDNVKKAADKVRGVRPPKRPAPPTDVPPGTTDPEGKAREQGQRGYVEIADFFRQYIERLTKLTGYAPSNPAITLAELQAKHTAFDALNKSVPNLFGALSDAIKDRQAAYSTEDGLHYVFKGVKMSVKAQYGQSSSEYAQVKGIKW